MSGLCCVAGRSARSDTKQGLERFVHLDFYSHAIACVFVSEDEDLLEEGLVELSADVFGCGEVAESGYLEQAEGVGEEMFSVRIAGLVAVELVGDLVEGAADPVLFGAR